MTKARTLADYVPFDSTGVLTSSSSLDATQLTGTLPALNGSALTNLPSSGALVETGRVLLAQNETEITLDNCFTSEYENYLVIFSDITCTVDDQTLQMKFRIGGSSGSTDSVAQYRYACRYFDDDGAVSSNTGVDQSSIRIADGSEESLSWKGYNGTFTVYQPQLNASTRMTGNGSFVRNTHVDEDVVSSHNAMHYDSNTRHTGLHLYYGSGGIRSGASITVFGIKTT